jgi:anti-anti-sigma factor
VISVVVADDSAVTRRLVQAIVEEGGSAEVVGEARDGHEAVRLASELRPDVLVLDVEMPSLSGLEALPEIRRASPQTRVVMFSGDEHARDRAAELGADAFVEKRVTSHELHDTILRAAGLYPSDASVGAGPPRERALVEARVRLDDVPERVVVELKGELDVARLSATRGLLEAMLPMVGEVEVDLAGLEFIDVACVRMLLEIAAAGERAGCRLVTVGSTGDVARVFRVLGADRLLPVSG